LDHGEQGELEGFDKVSMTRIHGGENRFRDSFEYRLEGVLTPDTENILSCRAEELDFGLAQIGARNL
jgi:hypothetical protein